MGIILSKDQISVQKNESLIVYCNKTSSSFDDVKDICIQIANVYPKYDQEDLSYKIYHNKSGLFFIIDFI